MQFGLIGHAMNTVGPAGMWDVLAPQQPAIGVRVCAHPPVALGCQRSDLWPQPAIGVEQLLWPVAPHPIFKQLDVFRLDLSGIGTWWARQ
jgi:hypothetical protein